MSEPTKRTPYKFTPEDRQKSAEARRSKQAKDEAVKRERYWALREGGAQPYQAAAQAGMSRELLRTYQEDPSWLQREAMTDAATVEDIVGALKQAAMSGNVKAAEHMLSVLSPDRWGKIGKTAAVQIDARSINLGLPENATRIERIYKLLQRLEGRITAAELNPGSNEGPHEFYDV